MWWKVYVNSFQLLEVEVEKHLLEQVFPAVQNLCQAVYSSDAVIIEPDHVLVSPSLAAPSTSWCEVILTRLLCCQRPNQRKTFVSQIFSGELSLSLSHVSPDWIINEFCDIAAEACSHRGNKVGFNAAFTSFLAKYLVALPTYEERLGFIRALLDYPRTRKVCCWGMLAVLAVFEASEVECLDSGAEGGGSLWPVMGDEVVMVVRHLLGALLPDYNQLVGTRVASHLMAALEKLVGAFPDQTEQQHPSVTVGAVAGCLAEIPVDLLRFHCMEPVTRVIRKLVG